MKRVKRNSKLFKYLNSLGVLERGVESEIKAAKLEYRRQYLKKYKTEWKQNKKELVVTCSKEELARLVQGAKSNGSSPGRFFKKAAFAYLDQAFIIPHLATLQHIEQLLLNCKSNVERIAEREPGAWFKQDRNYADLEKTIQQIQMQIIETFAHPPTLETVITQTLKDKPEYIEIFKKIIANYDS
jgi:hypothetical protein